MLLLNKVQSANVQQTPYFMRQDEDIQNHIGMEKWKDLKKSLYSVRGTRYYHCIPINIYQGCTRDCPNCLS